MLYDRLRWLRGGYGVWVTMHNLLANVFGAEDHRSLQSEQGDILPCTNFGLYPLYQHDLGKFSSHVLLHEIGCVAVMVNR